MTQAKKPTSTSTNKLDPSVLPPVIDTPGAFLVLNTINVKGLRINTSRIINYAPSSETTIQVGWGDGVNSTLSFPNADAAAEALQAIDDRCL